VKKIIVDSITTKVLAISMLGLDVVENMHVTYISFLFLLLLIPMFTFT
jgi:hypothetical protein